MVNKDKVIKGMDHKVWIQFTAHCKAKEVKVSQELADILSIHLKKVNEKGRE